MATIPFIVYVGDRLIGKVYGSQKAITTYTGLSLPSKPVAYVTLTFQPSGASWDQKAFFRLWYALHNYNTSHIPMNTIEKVEVYRLMKLFNVPITNRISDWWLSTLTFTDYYSSDISMILREIPPDRLPPALRMPAPFTIKPVTQQRTLIDHFNRLAKLNSFIGEGYKAKAFGRAATELAQGTAPERLAWIRGLGASVALEVQEFQQTGTSRRMLELEAEMGDQRENVIKLFRGVYGIGPEIAPRLYDEGYRTLKDLEQAPLNNKQRSGLRWYHDLQKRIPRAEIDEYIKYLQRILWSTRNMWVVAGSYRRGKSSSGDIDILMRNDSGMSLEEIVSLLINAGLISEEDVLASGKRKFMAVGRLHPSLPGRRIDINLFEPDNWAYALLYNTGSQQLNILMRQRAIDMGLKLSEYDLTNPITYARYPAVTEEDIFRHLGLKYLPPEQRTDELTSLLPA